MSPTLTDLENIARHAGAILREGRGKRNKVTHKGVIDLVTEVDRRSETYILNEIRRMFPDDRIISEERGDLPGQDCCLWYIDPLDGTINYSHGVPIFAVSIAYAEDGNTCLGVVHDPTLDECYSAERGQGAWLNGR